MLRVLVGRGAKADVEEIDADKASSAIFEILTILN